MEFTAFENQTGEGIVSFEPWQTRGPEFEKDHSRWYCHLTVAGARVYEYGSPCGSCGIVFRKVGSPAHRVNDTEAVQLLGNLESIPSTEVLLRLARVLMPGVYYPTVIEGTVRLIEPGTADDYFSTDVVRLFGPEPPSYKVPAEAKTSYYRLGSDHQLDRPFYRGGTYKSLVTALVMPLHEPSQLNRERVEYWKRQYTAGVTLTAFAVSVIDGQAPESFVAGSDDTNPYAEQFLLSICPLDGHHRIQAAAELGVPVRILSFLTEEFSRVDNPNDIDTVLSLYSRL
jgi:hypothetical protein